MPEADRKLTWNMKKYKKWWTPEWYKAVNRGLFVKRDIEGGQMSRDMTLFVDDDGKAYHIYSSEENLTLHIAELTDDYLQHSGRYIRIFPGGHNEAPALFKKDNMYWMITSGCTGWDPNEARMFSASSIGGPWKQHPNPCRGQNSEKTFGGQSTFVLELPENRFIFMADVWKPKSLMYSRHIWLPIQFDEQGVPFIEWTDEVNLSAQSEWKLVWSDEFNTDGLPDTTVWSYDNGFARNEEAQWYQKGNAYCKDGKLIIEARKEKRDVKIPGMRPEVMTTGGRSGSLLSTLPHASPTAGKKEFLYGRFEVRAKIPVSGGGHGRLFGLWAVVWNGLRVGEIDIMEYYRIKGEPHILANAAGELTGSGMQDGIVKAIPFTHFTDKELAWADKFHIWRMDWDETAIKIYLDDELLNEIPLSETVNGIIGKGTNPFRMPQYLC